MVRLSEHRRESLLQDVEVGELRAFIGHIHIEDPAICDLQFGLAHREHVRRNSQAERPGTFIGAEGCEVLNRIYDYLCSSLTV